MIFNSFEFLIFFFVVTIIYFALPHKYRWFHLLISSCIFYMYAIPVYILVLFLTIIIDYIAGRAIEQAQGHKRKLLLVVSIICNVGILAFFKYYNFFTDNINSLLHIITPASKGFSLLNILLPIGLSFHTFQAMSYIIEVYRGTQKAERNFGIYALYVMFYPQLVAGPIEPPQHILHQFYERHNPDYDNISAGIRRMLWGMFKKVVIADRLAIVADQIYDSPSQYSGVAVVLGTVFFSFQLYCDFSGYCDIALGAARVMGFRLTENFNHPNMAVSVSDYWRRWHLSLSKWFTQYVYFPLGGNRVSKWKGYRNLAIVMLLSGFWHGANWTFIIWGGIHAFYLIFANYTANARGKLNEFIGITKLPLLNRLWQQVVTFSLVSFSRIFFRATSLSDGWMMVKKLGQIPGEIAMVFKTHSIAFLHLPPISEIRLGFIVIVFLVVAGVVETRFDFITRMRSSPAAFRWTMYFSSLLIMFYFGVFDRHRFIYFQF